MGWLGYAALVLLVSALVGLHLWRFRDCCGEMAGMMIGMTMGMLNGFLLGYALAAASRDMFWGNLGGIMLGLALGALFGRLGGLMGVLDGAMGGVMGGSMGAMLAIMLQLPVWALAWTGALLAVIYAAGLIGLVVLVERRAPERAVLGRVAPWLAPATALIKQAPAAGLVDYYRMLGVPSAATPVEIARAYLAYVAQASPEAAEEAALALATLSDPARREAYDVRLATATARGECCPPPRRNTPARQATASASRPEAARPASPAPAAHSSRPAVDHYATLGVRPGAMHDEIIEAYLLRSQGAEEPAAEAIERARAVLLDPLRRQEYNRTRSVAARSSQRTAVVANGSPSSGAARNGGNVLLGLLLAAVVFVAILLGGSMIGGRAGESQTGGATQAELLTMAVEAPLDASGLQTLSIVVNGDSMSYAPSLIKVKKDMPVRFHLSVEGRDPG